MPSIHNRKVHFDISECPPRSRPGAATPINGTTRPEYPRHKRNKQFVTSLQYKGGDPGYIPVSPRVAKSEQRWRRNKTYYAATNLAPAISARSPRSHRISYDFLDPLSILTSIYPLSMLFSPISNIPSSAPSFFRISTKTGYFRWTIAIASYSIPTVADILAGIYKGLYTLITTAEHRALTGEIYHDEVVDAYTKRCRRRARGETEAGIRRIDFLAGKTKFAGVVEGIIWEFFVE